MYTSPFGGEQRAGGRLAGDKPTKGQAADGRTGRRQTRPEYCLPDGQALRSCPGRPPPHRLCNER